jgi:hypothetical protein
VEVWNTLVDVLIPCDVLVSNVVTSFAGDAEFVMKGGDLVWEISVWAAVDGLAVIPSDDCVDATAAVDISLTLAERGGVCVSLVDVVIACDAAVVESVTSFPNAVRLAFAREGVEETPTDTVADVLWAVLRDNWAVATAPVEMEVAGVRVVCILLFVVVRSCDAVALSKVTLKFGRARFDVEDDCVVETSFEAPVAVPFSRPSNGLVSITAAVETNSTIVDEVRFSLSDVVVWLCDDSGIEFVTLLSDAVRSVVEDNSSIGLLVAVSTNVRTVVERVDDAGVLPEAGDDALGETAGKVVKTGSTDVTCFGMLELAGFCVALRAVVVTFWVFVMASVVLTRRLSAKVVEVSRGLSVESV